MSEPAGFSNSSAGPPPGDFDTRSVMAAISRSGSTGSVTRASSRSLSSASMKLFRSRYIVANPLRQGLHPVGDRLCQPQRAQPIFPRNERRPRAADGVDEVAQLARERLFA